MPHFFGLYPCIFLLKPLLAKPAKTYSRKTIVSAVFGTTTRKTQKRIPTVFFAATFSARFSGAFSCAFPRVFPRTFFRALCSLFFSNAFSARFLTRISVFILFFHFPSLYIFPTQARKHGRRPGPQSALFACQNPETVLQTDRCAPGGCNCSAHRRAGGFQGLRTPFLRNPPAHRFLAQILGFPTNFLWGEKSGRKNFSQGVPRGLDPWGRRNHSFQPAHRIGTSVRYTPPMELLSSGPKHHAAQHCSRGHSVF